MQLLIYKENSTNCYFFIYLFGWETLVIENYLYKLAAVSKDFGIIVRPYIFTLHKMDMLSEHSRENIKKRMRILGICNIVSGKELSEQKIKF